MKKLLVVMMLVFSLMMFGGVANAGEINVEMSNWKLGGSDKIVFADFVITNNTNKYLNVCEITVVLYNNNKIVGSKSRLVADLPSNGFTSLLFVFRNTRSFSHYKYSISRLRFK